MSVENGSEDTIKCTFVSIGQLDWFYYDTPSLYSVHGVLGLDLCNLDDSCIYC